MARSFKKTIFDRIRLFINQPMSLSIFSLYKLYRSDYLEVIIIESIDSFNKVILNSNNQDIENKMFYFILNKNKQNKLINIVLLENTIKKINKNFKLRLNIIFAMKNHKDINLYIKYLLKILKKFKPNKKITIVHNERIISINLNLINIEDLDNQKTRDMMLYF